MTHNTVQWMPLDNAGKVFPGQNTNRWSNVFRLSVELKHEIDPKTLETALEKTLRRIPSFRVKLRSGFFGNYFEENKRDCPISHDIKNHCYRIGFRENNGYIFRVYYHKSRISIDIYHALCDGYGGAVFLMTLAGEYLRLKGYSISHNQFVLDINEKPKAEELEDAYERYATSKDSTKLLETPAYHKRGTKLPLHHCHYTSVTMSFKELHSLSKSYGVTVTELLAAILLDVHYRKQLSEGKGRKDVSVQIPVNLRKAFPSESLRNFVICLTVKMSPRKGKYTFEEILRSVSAQLKQVNNRKDLHAYITQTVKLQTKALKFIPLALKNTAVKVSFSFGAEYSTTALLSNLGPINVPEDMKEHIERCFFYTGPGLVNGARCGAVSFGDNLTLTFSNRYKEDEIETEFLRRLAELGLSATVETNRDTDYIGIEGITVGDSQAYSDEVFIPSKQDRLPSLRSTDITFKEKAKRAFHL